MKKPVIYALIQKRLKEDMRRDGCITKKDLFTMLGRVYHIPKEKRFPVLRELFEFRVVRWKERGLLEVR